jgi:hypothetical protein
MSSSNIQDFHIHNPVTSCLVATRQFRIADIHFLHHTAEILNVNQHLCLAKTTPSSRGTAAAGYVHFCGKWKRVTCFMLSALYLGRNTPWYPADRKGQDGYHIRSEKGGKVKNFSPSTEPNPNCPVRKLVIIQTRLVWLTSKSNRQGVRKRLYPYFYFFF